MRLAHNRHYKTAHWLRIRERVLARDRMCKSCGVNPSKDIDHIVARKDGGTDALENLQGLCTSCNSKKSIREATPMTSLRGARFLKKLKRLAAA